MMNHKEMAISVADILNARMAHDIVLFDISEMTIIADCFVICSGRTALQVRALYDDLVQKMAQQGISAVRREGVQDAKWVVVDFGSVVVHIFAQQEREFYSLERLWGNGTNQIPYTSEQ